MSGIAILDYIGFPQHAPGNLECRLAKATFRNGVYVSRGEPHRFVITPDDGDGPRSYMVPAVRNHLSNMGYALGDLSYADAIASHEWSIIADRRAVNVVSEVTQRIAVRALGFDLPRTGQLAVGFGNYTLRPDGVVKLIKKSDTTLPPDADISDLIRVVDEVADVMNVERLTMFDRSLLQFAGRMVAHDDKSPVRMLEHAELFTWRDANPPHTKETIDANRNT